MLDFALKTATASHTIDDSNIAALRDHGFSSDDIWDIASITAFFAYSNRMADLMALEPNPEFYAMGRG